MSPDPGGSGAAEELGEACGEPLVALVYVSRVCVEDERSGLSGEVEGILTHARASNERSAITGLLMFDEVCFAQILEGPGHEVDRLFGRIRLDTRHRDVTVLTREALPERTFGRWSMACVEGRAQLIHRFLEWRERDPAGSSAPPLDALLAEVEHLAGNAARERVARLFTDPADLSPRG